jgi:ribosomal protein L31
VCDDVLVASHPAYTTTGTMKTLDQMMMMVDRNFNATIDHELDE